MMSSACTVPDDVRQAMLDARARGSTHLVVTIEKACPRTKPGDRGVYLAQPRIMGRYLGWSTGRTHVYDVALDDLERLLAMQATP